MEEAQAIESPCTLVCTIELKSGYCYGCGRTGDEIAQWSKITPAERGALMELLPERVAGLERKPRRTTKRRQRAQRLNKEVE
jgi:predicted Fe-S protein YdhL (DUF1289 family)